VREPLHAFLLANNTKKIYGQLRCCSACSIFDECTYRDMLPVFILKYFRDLITAGDAGFLRNTLLSTSHWDLVSVSSYDSRLRALLSIVWPFVDNSSVGISPAFLLH